MKLDRNICKQCGKRNFSDSEYNAPFSMCNECFIKDYEQMQQKVLEIEKNKTWFDEATNLMWEKTQENNIDKIYTWAETFDYAKQLNEKNYAGYSDWRIPTIKELIALVNFMKFNPAIKEALLKNVASDFCWSSSEYAGDSSRAWGVYFLDSYTDWYGKSSKYYVRCVRGRQ